MNTYAYDSANRLASVNGTTTYSYNGLGDRVSQTVDSQTTTYVLDLNAGLTQVLDDGERTYIYGVGRISQRQGSTAEYFLGGALRSVRQLTNSNGDITLAKSYDPYGVVTGNTGSGTSPFAYTGEQQDASGVVYLRARYYSSDTGRFLSRDTWGGDYNNPLSLNRWIYVEGNPIMFVDPSGNKVTEEGVNAGIFIYSCNCGWIDTHHAVPKTTNDILNLLRIKVDLPWWANQDVKVLRLEMNFPVIPSVDNYFVVKINPGSNNKALALGILMAHEDIREAWHGIPGVRKFGGSYYSEEDLTSNLIGYYLAINNQTGLKAEDGDAGLNWLTPICKIPQTRQEAIEWSKDVFITYGETIDEWEKWANPRLICTSKIDEFCGDEPRGWPTQFSIESAAQPGGDWWRYKAGLKIKSDENENIYYLWP